MPLRAVAAIHVPRRAAICTARCPTPPEVLTRTLRDLERDGLVRREVFPTMPPRVEYGITALGADLGRISQAMGAWVVEHHAEITAARAEFDAARTAEPAPVPQPGRSASPISK